MRAIDYYQISYSLCCRSFPLNKFSRIIKKFLLVALSCFYSIMGNIYQYSGLFWFKDLSAPKNLQTIYLFQQRAWFLSFISKWIKHIESIAVHGYNLVCISQISLSLSKHFQNRGKYFRSLNERTRKVFLCFHFVKLKPKRKKCYNGMASKTFPRSFRNELGDESRLNIDVSKCYFCLYEFLLVWSSICVNEWVDVGYWRQNLVENLGHRPPHGKWLLIFLYNQ